MILNIHGLDGSCCNTNWRLLREMFNNSHVVSPQLDYRHLYLDYIDSQLNSYVRDITSKDKLDMVVGNCLGGFVGLHMAQKYDVPCILTDPWLRPDKHIRKIFPGYMNYSNRYTISYWLDNFRKDHNLWDNVHIIFGSNDELIDTSLSVDLSVRADIITIIGNYKLQGPEFEFEFRKMVNKLCIE